MSTMALVSWESAKSRSLQGLACQLADHERVVPRPATADNGGMAPLPQGQFFGSLLMLELSPDSFGWPYQVLLRVNSEDGITGLHEDHDGIVWGWQNTPTRWTTWWGPRADRRRRGSPLRRGPLHPGPGRPARRSGADRGLSELDLTHWPPFAPQGRPEDEDGCRMRA